MIYRTTKLWLGKLGVGSWFVFHSMALIAQESYQQSPGMASNVPQKVTAGQGMQEAGQNTQQTMRIAGRVSDPSGQPLAGVGISLRAGNASAVTDADGNFVISVPRAKGTLDFSYIGFTTRAYPFTETQTSLQVTLQPDVSAIDEVVVVGYGTQKKVNLTGAVASVTFDEKINSRAISNVSTALNGLLPGLAVNQSSGMAGNNNSRLLVRGLGTVNGDSGPLIVVDGMPDVNINRLNMQDIESVSVLKDAASSSVYGSRAANGVILITTKSGAGRKPTLTFNMSLATQKPTNAIGFMADYPRSLMVFRNAESMRNSYANARYRYGTIEEWMALGMIDPLNYPNTDWFDLVIRDGVQQNYNLSASGGNDVSNFYISAGMLDERGLQVGNDFKRYNARVNYDYKIRKNINVGAKINGDWSDYRFPIDAGFTGGSRGTGGYDLRFAVAGITPYDPVTGYYGGAMAYGEDIQVFNPLSVYNNEISKRNQKQFNGVFFVNWEPIQGLKGSVDYSLNYGDQFTVKADIPNQAYNFQQHRMTGRYYVLDNAGIENTTSTNYKTMASARVSYDRTFAEDHKMTILGVYSEEFWHTRNQFGSRLDRLHPSLEELNAALPATQVATGSSSKEGLRSVIGRLNYSAFDRYLLEANFRYDGSSKFYPGHQWGFFPSASVGWRFTEEKFLSVLKDIGIANGKLRGSYGSLGNNNIVTNIYEQREVLTQYNYLLNTSGSPTIYRGFGNDRLINRAFSWEKTNVMNIGLDFVVLKNRLSAEFDYYDRVTKGMAENFDISMHISGMYRAPRHNIGQMRNRGVEANLTWTDTKGDFTYRLNLNASHNRNRLENWGQQLLRGQTFIDMPYGFLYSYEDAGIAQDWQDVYNATPQDIAPGDLIRLDLNGDGRIDGNDQKAYPNTQRSMPHTNFALNSSFSYKGFDLNFQLQGAAGRKDFWLTQYNVLDIGPRYAASWDHWENPWNVENRDGEWPRLNGAGSNVSTTSFWLDNLSYLRIRNVQVGYNVPPSLLSRVKVNSFRIFLSAENLHTFTSYRGLDPESTASMNDVYPLVKAFSLGLNINL